MPALKPLAITMGEPGGVGPDIALQLYARRLKIDAAPFAIYAPLAFLQKRAERLGLDIKFKPVLPEYAIETFAEALPVVSLDGEVPDAPGELSAANAPVVITAIERAVADVRSGVMRGLVTAPIQKSILYRAGFNFPGHTEFLAELCANGKAVPVPVMMLTAGTLRVVPVTVHVPLHEVAWRLTTKLIAQTGRIVHAALRDRLAIKTPRLAVTGLNPHAGEDGAMGDHEVKVIRPAIEALSAEGIDVTGPLPADTAFTPDNRTKYDAIIAMYHDQALIPIKALAFDEAVNVTLGLPIIRTSPDHGTALALAGTGNASIKSFANALRLADNLTRYG